MTKVTLVITIYRKIFVIITKVVGLFFSYVMLYP